MDLRDEFTRYSPEMLHHVYGINCFQHAIGYELPIISRTQENGNEIVNYVRLQPGSILNEEPLFNTEAGYRQMLSAWCREEGMIFSGSRCVQRDGYRTLALYIGEPTGPFDFHFSFLNERGKWETKLPFNGPLEYDKVREAGLGMYDFQTHALIPFGTLPKAISEWCPKIVSVPMANGHTIHLGEIDGNSRRLVANQILFDRNRKICKMIEQGHILPLPPWPISDISKANNTPRTPIDPS